VVPEVMTEVRPGTLCTCTLNLVDDILSTGALMLYAFDPNVVVMLLTEHLPV